jgi:hypothetical protein
MSREEERVYMLLELERIRSLGERGLYVMPKELLEFEVYAFRNRSVLVFRIFKHSIFDGWMLMAKSGVSGPSEEPLRSNDIGVLLSEIEKVVRDSEIEPLARRRTPSKERILEEMDRYNKSKCTGG